MWHAGDIVADNRYYPSGFKHVEDVSNFHSHSDFKTVSRGDDGAISYLVTSDGITVNRVDNTGRTDSCVIGDDYYPTCIGASFNRVYVQSRDGMIKSHNTIHLHEPSREFRSKNSRHVYVTVEPAYDDLSCALYNYKQHKLSIFDIGTGIEEFTEISLVWEVRAMQKSVWLIDQNNALHIMDTRASLVPVKLTHYVDCFFINSYYESLNAFVFYSANDMPCPRTIQCGICDKVCYDYGLFDLRNCARYVLGVSTITDYHLSF